MLQLLDEFQSCSINIFEFLQVAQPLRPRYYSTSSSQRIHGTVTAHIAVGSHGRPVPGMPDREFQGMSSHYVHTLREGDRMNVFLDRAEGFHLQDDVQKPMILVSAGTGYAPMRAFLWERLAMQGDGVMLASAPLMTAARSDVRNRTSVATPSAEIICPIVMLFNCAAWATTVSRVLPES